MSSAIAFHLLSSITSRLRFFESRFVSPFIVIRDKYNNISDIKGILFNTWNLEPPKVMVSLTGAAASFKSDEWNPALQASLVSILERVYQATMKLDGWIVDGGSNAGCMKMMGQAIDMSEFRGQVILLTFYCGWALSFSISIHLI